MTDILKGKTILAEVNENDIGCLVIVSNEDIAAATDAIKQVHNIWLNHENSDEHMDLLSDQIAYILGGKNIDYLMPDFEEI